jgi:hypothetical protein
MKKVHAHVYPSFWRAQEAANCIIAYLAEENDAFEERYTEQGQGMNGPVKLVIYQKVKKQRLKKTTIPCPM